MAISTKRISAYMIVGVLLAAVVIAAVYSSGVRLPSSTTGSDNSGGPGSTQLVSRSGTLVVAIKDAPVQIAELWVTIDSIEVNSDQNGWTSIPLLDGQPTQPFDLLKLQNSALDLSQVQLAAGTYNKVRLHVSSAESADEVDGQRTSLKVPSGKIDVIISFEVKEGESTKVLIDMTADWVAISASHNLRPVLKATVTYDQAPSNSVQQTTGTSPPDQTQAPTETPSTPAESPPVESPTPTATPSEIPATTASTSA